LSAGSRLPGFAARFRFLATLMLHAKMEGR
jgi:hypothetical protein